MSRDNEKGGFRGIYFLSFIIFLYLLIYVFFPEKVQQSLMASLNLLIKLLPLIVVVIFIMGIVDYVMKPKAVMRHMGEGSGKKAWLLAISTGIIIHGPGYAWYPLLKDLKEHGMRDGLVAAFLYSRAIKLPLLPMMVYYFGLKFTIILVVYMLLASILEGVAIDIILRNKTSKFSTGELNG